ncbi:DNA-processing protein DprA, partial [Acinetobacter baumannii]
FEQFAIAPNQQSEVHFDLKNNDEANENFVADTSETSTALDVNPLQIELITESDKQADKNTEEMRLIQIQQKYGAIFE